MDCTPYTGELDDLWRPITETGELYLPGNRLCGHKDCINPDHIEGTAKICHCGQLVYLANVCTDHYLEQQRNQIVNETDIDEIVAKAGERPQGTTCAYPGCERPYKAKALCFTHYMRWYKRNVINPKRELQ